MWKQIIELLYTIVKLLKSAGKLTFYTIILGGSTIVIIGGGMMATYLNELKQTANEFNRAIGQINYIYESVKDVNAELRVVSISNSILHSKINDLEDAIIKQNYKLNNIASRMPDSSLLFRQFLEINMKIDSARRSSNNMTEEELKKKQDKLNIEYKRIEK